MQLVHVQAAMDLAQPAAGLSLPQNFPEGWFQDEMLVSISNLNLTTSKLQLSVSKSLKQLGFNHVVEHTISMKKMAEIDLISIPPKDIDVLSIDIANLEEKIAIEVDGPYHFILCIDSGSLLKSGNINKIQNEYQANGATMLKRRLLTLMGWKVLNIPYWEWYKLEGNNTREVQYCQRLLSSVTR
jgi:hypothetical protein